MSLRGHRYRLALEHADSAGAIEQARDAIPGLSRRELISMTVAGAVVTAGAGASRASAADQQRSDVAILNYALSLEYLQAAFYTEAERRGALSGGLAEQARVVGSHERAHVAALLGQLGSAALKRPSFDFRGVTEEPKSFRETAVALEDLTVAAYQDKAPLISSRGYLAAIVGIQSVEARHASWIRRLAGDVPAPTAFDEPASQAHVTRLVGSTNFVVDSARTAAGVSPPFTG